MRPYPRIYPLALVFFGLLCAGHLPAQEEAGISVEEAIRQRLRPMNTTGLDKRLVRFLENYYAANFGGESNWQTIESVRFEGKLHQPGGSLRFMAYKKKPNLIKIVIYLQGGELIMAYDGTDAWQMDTRLQDARPSEMPAGEALNFIRDATTGGHLLYPQLPGKTIRFGGTRLIEEDSCLDVTVTLPSGQTVTYAVNLANSAEKQQITQNAVSGQTEVTTHHAYRTHRGVRFPVSSSLTIDDALVHRLEISSIEINTGATPWMFQRPSAGFIPPAESAPPPTLPPAEPGTTFGPPPSFFEVTIPALPERPPLPAPQ